MSCISGYSGGIKCLALILQKVQKYQRVWLSFCDRLFVFGLKNSTLLYDILQILLCVVCVFWFRAMIWQLILLVSREKNFVVDHLTTCFDGMDSFKINYYLISEELNQLKTIHSIVK